MMTNLKISPEAVEAIRNSEAETEGAASREPDAVVTTDEARQNRVASRKKKRRKRKKASASKMIDCMIMDIKSQDQKKTPTLELPRGDVAGVETKSEAGSHVSSMMSESSDAMSVELTNNCKALSYDDDDICVKVVMKGSLKKLRNKLEKQTALNLDLCMNLSVMEDKLQKTQHRAEALAVEKADLHQANSLVEKSLHESKIRAESFQNELGDVKKERGHLKNSVSAVKTELANVLSELAATKEQSSLDLTAADKEISILREKLRNCEEQLDKLDRARVKAEGDRDCERTRCHDLSNEIQAALAKQEKLRQEVGEIQRHSDKLSADKRCLQDRLLGETKSAEAMSKAMEELRKEHVIQDQQLRDATQTNARLDEMLKALKKQSATEQQQSQALYSKEQALAAKYVELKTKHKDVAEKERHAVQQAQHFQQSLAEDQAKLKEESQINAALQAELDAQDEQLAQSQAALTVLKATASELREEVDDLHVENAELNGEIVELEKAHAGLKQDNAGLRRQSAEAEHHVKALKRQNTSLVHKEKQRRSKITELQSLGAPADIPQLQSSRRLERISRLGRASSERRQVSTRSSPPSSSEAKKARVQKSADAELAVVQHKLHLLGTKPRSDDGLKKLVKRINSDIESHRELWDQPRKTVEPSLSPFVISSAEATPDSVRDMN